MIAVTVPHSYCKRWKNLQGTNAHECDSLAVAAAYQFQEAYKQHFRKHPLWVVQDPVAQIFTTNLPRQQCDFNRPSCRPNTQDDPHDAAKEWRKQVWSWIQQTGAKWLFDFHSFPPNQQSFQLPRDPEIVLLVHSPTRLATQQLAKFLEEHKVDVKVVEGAGVQSEYRQNANVVESLDVNNTACASLVDAFLVEFCESLSEQRLAQICQVLVQFVTKYPGKYWEDYFRSLPGFEQAQHLIKCFDTKQKCHIPGLIAVDFEKQGSHSLTLPRSVKNNDQVQELVERFRRLFDITDVTFGV